MTNTRSLAGSAGACLVLLLGCGADPLLGEDGPSCYGKETVCTSDAPSYSFDDGWGESIEFDVTPSKPLAATWRYALPCETGHCDAAIAVAPEGHVWVAQIQPKKGELLRLDMDGEIVDRHEWVPAEAAARFQLTVDVEHNPLLIQDALVDGEDLLLGKMMTQVIQVDAQGRLSESERASISHELVFPGMRGDLHFLGPQGGSSLKAESYGPDGLVWRQTELRANAHDQNMINNLTIGGGATPLRDGGFAFWTGKETPGGGGRYAGISVIDAQGNLRWDARLTDLGGGYRLAEGKTGSLVASFAFGAGDLHVAQISATGQQEATWIGRRTDYFALIPALLAIDPAGDIYVGLITGQRNAPELSICRLSAESGQQDISCASVGPALKGKWGDDLWRNATLSSVIELASFSRYSGMVAPQPGTLLLLGIDDAAADSADAGASSVMQVTRLDFP